MRQYARTMIPALATLFWAASGFAEEEKQLQNQVTGYLMPGASDREAVIEMWMANVNPVIGVSLPFKFATGGDSLSFDSLRVYGGRAEEFIVAPPFFQPTNQTFLLNMLWGLDSAHTAPPIAPGEGPFLWLYLSTRGKFPLDKFKMAAVQMLPQNVLMYITDSYNPVNPAFELVRRSPPAEVPSKSDTAGTKKGESP